MSDLGNKEIFSNNLKYYMKLFKKERNDICHDLCIAYTTFTDWYNGNVYPRIDKIELLANYFGIQKSDLIEKGKDLTKETLLKVPILNNISLNNNSLLDENIIDYIYIKSNTILNTNQNYFAIEVIEDNMMPILSKGDLAIVHIQDTIENGQTAILFEKGKDSFSIKRVVKTNNAIELHSMNPYYPIDKYSSIDDITIVGRIIKAEVKKIFE